MNGAGEPRRSAFADVGAVEPQRIWEGVVARAVHTQRLTMGLIELDAGAVVPEHSHAQEQVGILLAGALWFAIGGEERDLAVGGMWTIPPNVPHSVQAGPDGAVAFEIFAPARDDWRGLAAVPRRHLRWPVG